MDFDLTEDFPLSAWTLPSPETFLFTERFPLTADFPLINSSDLPPADLLQLEASHARHHNPLGHQAYGLYGVSGSFDFFPQAQLPGGQVATTQNHALHPLGLSTVFPGYNQHDAGFASNDQVAATAPAMPALHMDPPARPRKRKAPALRDTDWEPYKNRILDLHVTQGLPLSKVGQIMQEEHGFKAGYVTLFPASQSESAPWG